MIRTFAQDFECKAVGIEANPVLYLYSRSRAIGSHNQTFLLKDIFTHTYSDADCIYLYLFPSVLEKLKPKLLKECKKGTIIISHTFKIPGLHTHLIKKHSGKPHSTYMYAI